MKMKIRTIPRVDPAWLQREMGRKLRAERTKRKFTVQAVGDGLGLTRAAISNYELGNGSISLSVLYNLALFYKVPVASLLP